MTTTKPTPPETPLEAAVKRLQTTTTDDPYFGSLDYGQDVALAVTALAEARRDTQRLDWLEVQEEKTGRYIWEHDSPPRTKPYPGGHFIAVDHESSPFYGDTYRAAIDAAMLASGKWEGKTT